LQIGRQFVVSAQVDQLDNRRTGILWELLANPAGKDGSHAYNLQQLIIDFPQSGLLHALFAYTGDESNLQQAAAYFNPRTLYKIINMPDDLAVVEDRQIFPKAVGHHTAAHFYIEEDAPVTEDLAVIQEHAEENLQQGDIAGHAVFTPGTEVPENEPHAGNAALDENENYEEDLQPIINIDEQESPVNIIEIEEAPESYIPAETEKFIPAYEIEDEYRFDLVEPVLPSAITEQQHINWQPE
jgi:hypothetical protein